MRYLTKLWSPPLLATLLAGSISWGQEVPPPKLEVAPTALAPAATTPPPNNTIVPTFTQPVIDARWLDVVNYKTLAKGKYLSGILLEPIGALVKSQLGIKEGVAVVNLVETSPEAKAGVKLHDIVIKVNQTAVATVNDYVQAMQAHDEKTPVQLTVQRIGQQSTVTFTPEKMPVALDTTTGRVIGESPAFVYEAVIGPDGKRRLIVRERDFQLSEAPRVRLWLQHGTQLEPSQNILVEDKFTPAENLPWIGVQLDPEPLPLVVKQQLGIEGGLIVQQVYDDTPAKAAGVQVGDILLYLADEKLTFNEVLSKKVQASEGKPLSLGLLRTGKPLKLEVTPQKRQPAPESTKAEITFNPADNSPSWLSIVGPGMVEGARKQWYELGLPEGVSCKIEHKNGRVTVQIHYQDKDWEVSYTTLAELPEAIRPLALSLLPPLNPATQPLDSAGAGTGTLANPYNARIAVGHGLRFLARAQAEAPVAATRVAAPPDIDLLMRQVLEAQTQQAQKMEKALEDIRSRLEAMEKQPKP